jgi:hypothetical protein
MGDPNASIPTPQPVHYRPMFGSFGKALKTSVTFVSQAALNNPALAALGLQQTADRRFRHAHAEEIRHGAQRRHAGNHRRSRNLRGQGRRRASGLRAGDRAAAGPALLPVLLTMLIFTRTHPARHRLGGLAYDERKRSRLKVSRWPPAPKPASFSNAASTCRVATNCRRKTAAPSSKSVAAPEKLIEAVADSPLLFARAAYHLGNRHVPVQILPTESGGKLRFQTDHVLAEMVRGLGCAVSENRGAVPAGIRRLRRWPSARRRRWPTCTIPATARIAPCQKSTSSSRRVDRNAPRPPATRPPAATGQPGPAGGRLHLFAGPGMGGRVGRDPR